MSKLSRRALLGFGALAGVGGVVGAAPAAATTPAARGFTWQGRAMRRLAGRGTPAVGDVHTVRGELADPTTGVSRGEVFHTAHVVARTGGGHTEDVATVEQQLFVLPDGTLAGSGTVTLAGRGTFVVTGGTGRYGGARGSYTTVQSADAVGGGTAEYRFDLSTEL